MELLKTNSIQKAIKIFALIFLGTMALTVSAKLKIPFYPVPMTMQTFVVLLLGMVLGYKLAAYTVILYLLQGSIGLHVFAKGGGIAYLIGPTGGYLIGFIFTAFFAGKIKIKDDPIIIFVYLLFSVSISYILGLCGLWNYMGLDKNFNEVFLAGAQPFLIIEIYKILILTVLSHQLMKLRNFI